MPPASESTYIQGSMNGPFRDPQGVPVEVCRGRCTDEVELRESAHRSDECSRGDLRIGLETQPPTSMGSAREPQNIATTSDRECCTRPSWNIAGSELCLRTLNPIRKIVGSLSPSSSSKKTISLALGDPTTFGHLPAFKEAGDAVADALKSGQHNGYPPSSGQPEARQAIAEYLSSFSQPFCSYSPEDVFVTPGCSFAIQACLDALANPGRSILLPRPGFPVYDCWCAAAGLEVRRYPLLPDRGWEADCGEVARLADDNTAVALLLCNPGNPAGNVFSRKHLQEIVILAETLRLPIISDEIYSSNVFGAAEFLPVASVASEMKSPVPVLTVGSISKTHLLPGWRLGWVAVWDPASLLRRGKVTEALVNRLQYAPSACSLIQGALPRILRSTCASFFASVNRTLEEALTLSLRVVRRTPGLDCPSEPQGGMFLMVRIEMVGFGEMASDAEWCRRLLAEEAVVVIPGSACEQPGWFRSLLAAPPSVLEEAWGRIHAFCQRHYSSP